MVLGGIILFVHVFVLLGYSIVYVCYVLYCVSVRVRLISYQVDPFSLRSGENYLQMNVEWQTEYPSTYLITQLSFGTLTVRNNINILLCYILDR